MRVLSRLTIRWRLLAGFGAVLALTLVVGLVAWLTLGSTASTYDSALQNEARATKDALEMKGALQDQVIGVRGFLLTGDAKYLQPYLDGTKAFDAEVAAVAEKKLGQKRTAMLAAIKAKYAVLGPIYEQEIALARAGHTDQAVALAQAKGKPAKDATVAEIQAFIDRSQEKMYLAADGARASATTARWVVIALLVGVLLVGFAIAWLIARSVTTPIARLQRLSATAADGDLTVEVGSTARDEVGAASRAFDQMIASLRDIVGRVRDGAGRQAEPAGEMARAATQSGQAVGQIAATVEGVAKGSSEQAQAAQVTSETVSQMLAGVAQADSAGQAAAHVSERAGVAAEGGVQTVHDATDAMDRVKAGSEAVGQAVQSLARKGEAIGAIVGSITQIAGQTNLLALNAAIEAARAGEAGRGFAVVAEEVRKLAEEANGSAAEIARIVSEVQDETARAVSAMDAGGRDVADGIARVSAAGTAFEEIRAQVEELAGAVSQVAAATEELRSGAEQVQEQVGHVAAVSQENAAAAEEVSASTEESSAAAEQVAASAQQVSAQAEELAELVRRFRV